MNDEKHETGEEDKIYFEQGSDNDDMSDEEDEFDQVEDQLDDEEAGNMTTPNANLNDDKSKKLQYRQLPVGAQTTKQTKAKQSNMSIGKNKQSSMFVNSD